MLLEYRGNQGEYRMKKLRRWLKQWWKCRTQQCDYYQDYLAYGPADLTHIGYHAACRKAELHFKHCTRVDVCSACSHWEKAIRS
jgi:hypothetical protein